VSLLKRPEPLRDEVRSILRERVLTGELAPGEDINESELAEQLGVSRTPLREALLRLEHEGLVGSRQGHGFYVWPLDPHEALDLYEVAGALEAFGLRTVGRIPEEQIERLRSLDSRLRNARRDPARLARLGLRWHETLVEDVHHGPLREALQLVWSRLQRYLLYESEYAVANGTDDLAHVLREHEGIEAALEAGDLESAAALAEEHRVGGYSLLHRWLEEAAAEA